MSMDQDSLLSAYLDGQVDPDQKRRAESAVASDPAAAEALHALAAVRDLVAGLSRPPAPDVSVAVLSRLAADAARPRPWKTWGPYVGRGLGAAGIAASVAMVVVLGGQARSWRLVEPPQVASTLVVPVPAPVSTVATPSTRTEAVATAQPKPVGPAPISTPAPAVTVVESRVAQRDDPPGFREFWATAGPRRDFAVTTDAGESTTATVATLVGQSTHRDFYKIVVPTGANGVPGDEAAVAFAATLDPNEFTTLQRRLESHFGKRVEERDADPEVSALLADVGQATSSPATPAADVLVPQTGELALRVRSGSPVSSRPEPAEASNRSDKGRTSPARPEDAPAPPATADPTRPSIVLIWIVGPAPR
ncbi:MAG: hypothetical protein P4L85_02390 [Paludisphaera borealis]|uniref:hypothetical protein n=1 Tax=Paludisphaera borealis TaxID=1387353 RepID=UPI0028414DAC|nr:hypothetical protein [Paludisphaera borealis]MDR3618172.1 hypothetical protein [Paludisphaera borealis]